VTSCNVSSEGHFLSHVEWAFGGLSDLDAQVIEDHTGLTLGTVESGTKRDREAGLRRRHTGIWTTQVSDTFPG
jgi:hypothetical protein